MTPKSLLQQFDVLAEAPNGVQKLRELVLELAVRGKLVPQDESDEPVGVLLERISSVKGTSGRQRGSAASLSAEDAVPFEIPAAWAWTQLEGIGTVKPRNVLADDTLVGFCPMSSLPQVYGGPVGFEERLWRDIKKAYTHFADGDVVVAKITPCFQNGKAAVMRGLPSGVGAGTTELHVFRPIDGTVLPDFVLLFLKSPGFVEGGVQTMTGTAGQQRVSRDYFARSLLPFPPLAEQRRIVAKVDELMVLCDELEERQHRRAEALARLNRSVLHHVTVAVDDAGLAAHWQRLRDNFGLLYDTPETVVELRRAVVQLAVRGQLVAQHPSDEAASVTLERIRVEQRVPILGATPPSSLPLPQVDRGEVPFYVPGGWEWARFADIARIASNLVDPSLHSSEPHVAPDNIEKGTGRLLGYRTVGEDEVRSSNHRFFPGQILYSKIRPNLSKAVLVDFGGLCSADMYPIDARIDVRFLLTYMLSSTFLSIVVKSDTRVAMPKINQSELSKVLVPVPPIPEQRRIVTKVDELMALCDRLETQLTVAREQASHLAASVVHRLTAA